MEIEKYVRKHSLEVDSRKLKQKSLFCCALGNYDKKPYIKMAKKKKALVISDSYYRKQLKVNNPNLFLYELLDYKYHYPLLNKTLIGITGTDGKTTCVSILRYMLKGASIGTNGLEYGKSHLECENTTPDLVQLFSFFYLLNKKKYRNIIMEVSSESYLTRRIPYLSFDVGLFLNISKEHLDKHCTFQNYLACKKELLLNSRISIIYRDSKYFKKITKGLQNYYTYGKKKSDLRLISYKLSYDKTCFDVLYNGEKYHIISPLLGKYNINNLMACMLTMLISGYKMEEVIKRISHVKTIPGRMEKLDYGNLHIMIDYAHTIEATRSILTFLKKYCHKKIITVIGCAGGRYHDKRKIIGKLALKYSYKVFFTMDDPRDEDPWTIIEEMLGKSIKNNYEIVIDRKMAILEALKNKDDDTLILILGKGRDNYLAIGKKRIVYSDIDVIDEYLKKM